jgi:hypothetical protein
MHEVLRIAAAAGITLVVIGLSILRVGILLTCLNTETDEARNP